MWYLGAKGCPQRSSLAVAPPDHTWLLGNSAQRSADPQAAIQADPASEGHSGNPTSFKVGQWSFKNRYRSPGNQKQKTTNYIGRRNSVTTSYSSVQHYCSSLHPCLEYLGNTHDWALSETRGEQLSFSCSSGPHRKSVQGWIAANAATVSVATTWF